MLYNTHTHTHTQTHTHTESFEPKFSLQIFEDVSQCFGVQFFLEQMLDSETILIDPQAVCSVRFFLAICEQVGLEKLPQVPKRIELFVGYMRFVDGRSRNKGTHIVLTCDADKYGRVNHWRKGHFSVQPHQLPQGERVLRSLCVSICNFVPVKQVN